MIYLSYWKNFCGRGRQGGEITQKMYAHVNKWTKNERRC
jgi:hypothetical protein